MTVNKNLCGRALKNFLSLLYTDTQWKDGQTDVKDHARHSVWKQKRSNANMRKVT